MKHDIQAAVDALNDAFRRDRVAVENLIRHRVDCNHQLAEHPTVQVRAYPGLGEAVDSYSASTLGLLNGVLEPLTGQRVAIVVEDETPEAPGKMLGFTVYKK
jgi:hypothetical protein